MKTYYLKTIHVRRKKSLLKLYKMPSSKFKNLKHYVFVILCIYILASLIEHSLHKYVMHNESNIIGKWHLIHHRHTRKDMSLDTSGNDYKEILPSENIAIDDINSMVALFIGFILIPYLFYRFYPVKLKLWILLGFGILLGIYTVLIWNSIHSYMHGKDAQKMGHFSLCNKSTKFLVDRSPFLRWLIENHKKFTLFLF